MRHDDTAACLFKQLYGGEACRWPKNINETGNEESNLNAITFHGCYPSGANRLAQRLTADC